MSVLTSDIEGLFAIIPTPATPDAHRADATDTIEVDETARLVDCLIEDGASGILALGTTGECPTLSDPDYRAFVDCLVAAVAGRVPLLIGATAMGTHETVRRLRYLAGAGVDGSLLGLPMWQPVTVDAAVQFYRDISAMFPELALMVYANARAFRFDFPPEFWEAVAVEAPTVCAAKVSRSDGLADLQRRTGGRIHFLPNEMRVHEFHHVSPHATTALWATSASMGPGPALGILEAVRAHDLAAIDRWATEIAWVHEPIRDVVADPRLFASFNIQIEKARMDEVGYCRPGPCRPPYAELPAALDAAARACGRRWRDLDERRPRPLPSGSEILTTATSQEAS